MTDDDDTVEVLELDAEQLARRAAMEASLHWRPLAACRGDDPELFFPGRGESTAVPQSICARCPVRVPCLEYALDANEKFGVWGGASERERRRIRRERRQGGVS